MNDPRDELDRIQEDRDRECMADVALLVIVFVVLGLIFLSTGKAIAMPKKPPPTPEFWQKVAEFYAGAPVNLFLDSGEIGTLQGQRKQSGIHLSPEISKSLRSWDNPVLGARGLATLIHEALHARKPWGQAGQGDEFALLSTGLRDWDNEAQANALGSELVPDLMQRFFGIKIDSPLSRRYEKAAKSLSGYQSAYANPIRRQL